MKITYAYTLIYDVESTKVVNFYVVSHYVTRAYHLRWPIYEFASKF